MSLEQGRRLGPYEVVAPIGAGGMGQVYRARDTRLDRSVAVKVLPPHLSSDPGLRQRFEREARTVSSLNHPHICALYDIGRQDDVDYLVMEHLEGETVAARLERGPLAPPDLLRYAVQIADALDAAHRQGIVHRDLKPGNVMITKSGAKLLDFGLARSVLQAPAGGMSGLATSPTMTKPLTAEGSIVGTFQYMAPEQLEGKEADARSDIFAFGALVYEMATGRRAFEGKSQASLIAAIMGGDPPPLSSLQPMAPPALDRLVTACLAKDPGDRWQTAHDVRLQLQWIAEGASQASMALPAPAARKAAAWLPWALAAALAVAGLALGIALLRSPAGDRQIVTASINAPEGHAFHFRGSTAGPPEVSPDGRQIAFVAATDRGQRDLWVRRLDSPEAVALAGTVGAVRPFWSPDSRQIGFFADGKLKRIDAAGGTPTTICDAPDARGGTWNAEGVIVFAPAATGPLHRVPAAGGASTPVTEFSEGAGDASLATHRYPWFLPDGKHFLYLERLTAAGGSRDPGSVRVGSLDGGEGREILRGVSNAMFASGRILYTRDAVLMAQPFDPVALETTGDPVPLAPEVRVDSLFSRAMFSVSVSGVLIYQAGKPMSGSVRLVWVGRDGSPSGEVGEPGYYVSMDPAPDDRTVLATIIDPGTANIDAWIVDVGRGISTRATFGPEIDYGSGWWPDGSRVIISRNSGDGTMILALPATGGGDPDMLVDIGAQRALARSVSPDGRFLAYSATAAPAEETGSDVWILPLGDGGEPYPFLNSSFDESFGIFSPDGRWLAYSSDESGAEEIYLTSFPSGAGKWRISAAGGTDPQWSRRGDELFYVAADNSLMSVPLEVRGDLPEAGEARRLFAIADGGSQFLSRYRVSADPGRFLTGQPVEETAPSPLTLVLNWAAGLPR